MNTVSYGNRVGPCNVPAITDAGQAKIPEA